MATAFLTSVKDELTTLFAVAYDEMVGEGEPPEKIAEAMKRLQKRTWELFEKKLKESFSNGKKATDMAARGGRKPDPPEGPTAPANPFRKSS